MTAVIRAHANGLAAIASVAAIWLWTWRHLAIEWRFNDQYAFGYAVPWLAVCLAWPRLRQSSGKDAQPVAEGSRRRWLALAWLAIPLFLLAELFRRQDPTWRLVGWLMTSAATLLTVGWLGQIGSAPLVRTLAFPLAFAWLALPWPSLIENPLTLGLLHFVTRITADVLNWMGIAALQRGNLIELRNAVVGVDTACSGVQSFQAALMATLFMGELVRLSVMRRLILVVGGALAALAANLARVLTLAWLASQQGEAAIDRYHDRVGGVATLALFLVIALLASLLSHRKAAITPPPAVGAPAVPWPRWRFEGRHGLAWLLAVVLVPLLAQWWFRSGVCGDFAERTTPLWRIKASHLPGGWRVRQEPFIPEEIRLLRFTQATALDLWSAASGYAQVTHLFWAPEATVPSQAFSHRPEICLPSAGWQRVGSPQPATVMVHGVQVDGSLFIFRLDGIEETVFHAVWYGGKPLALGRPPRSLGGRASRFALLWNAPTRLGHETLTVFLRGAGNPQERHRRLEVVLGTVLEPATSSPAKTNPRQTRPE